MFLGSIKRFFLSYVSCLLSRQVLGLFWESFGGNPVRNSLISLRLFVSRNANSTDTRARVELKQMTGQLPHCLGAYRHLDARVEPETGTVRTSYHRKTTSWKHTFKHVNWEIVPILGDFFSGILLLLEHRTLLYKNRLHKLPEWMKPVYLHTLVQKLVHSGWKLLFKWTWNE